MTSTCPQSMLPFLQKLESRSRLTSEEGAIIVNLPFHPRHVKPNQDFVLRGDETTHSCFVLEGLVGTFGQNRRGDRQITSVFLTGDMIDLETVVVPQAVASLQALVATTILQVPHGALRAAARQFPGIAEAFWRECVINAAILSEWVVNVGRRDARSRLAHLFCELACRAGHIPMENKCAYAFPITQDQRADMLGLTSVHVNRTLKGLREDGIVEMVSRRVHILNWQRLAQIGDFDSDYLKLQGPQGPCQPSATEPERPMRMAG